jgi:hypothetical protein
MCGILERELRMGKGGLGSLLGVCRMMGVRMRMRRKGMVIWMRWIRIWSHLRVDMGLGRRMS